MICDPGFFDPVASKGFTRTVSLLFATLAGRSIGVAAKGLKATVARDPDRVPTGSGSSIGAGHWTVVSEEKSRRRKLETDERARIGCDPFRQGRNLPDETGTGRSGIRASIHKTQ